MNQDEPMNYTDFANGETRWTQPDDEQPVLIQFTKRIRINYDNKSMTEQELEYLAEIISQRVLDKLIAKQREWDMQFTNDVMHIMQSNPNIQMADKEELLLAEMARLMTLLSTYEDKEEYEKAAIVQNKIRILQKKLDRL